MRIRIRWRVDTSEVYETDDCVMETDEWVKVFREVEVIEGCNCTVLSIERIDIG